MRLSSNAATNHKPGHACPVFVFRGVRHRAVSHVPIVRFVLLSSDASPLLVCAGEQEAGGKRKPWRILLTGEQARDIYLRRPGQENPGTSMALAAEFGVSVKTIRDIWNRETWIRSTRALWTSEEEQLHVAASQAKSDLSSAKATSASSFSSLPDPAPSAPAPPRKRELPMASGGGGKKIKTGKSSAGEAAAAAAAEEEVRGGAGMNDATADADAVAGLLMMCSAR